MAMPLDRTGHLEIARAGEGGWDARLILPDRRRHGFELNWDDGHSAPDLADGLVAAVLPRAMRHRLTALQVHGRMTRGAVWRLTEFARVWNSWLPNTWAATEILPDEIGDNSGSNPAAPALVAWSGGLASAHTLVRLIDGLAPGAPVVAGVIRLTGLRARDDRGIEQARRAVQSMGLAFHVVSTNALTNGWVDGGIGRLPIVAAALHAFCDRYSCGFHARSTPFQAHRLYPRPGPALPDLFSSSHFAVRADGGFVSMPRQLSDVWRCPFLVDEAWQVMAARPHADRLLMLLANRAAGLRPRTTGPAQPGPWCALRLPMRDPAVAAESEAIFLNWRTKRRWTWVCLAARLSLHRFAVMARDHARWLLAMARLGKVYPR